MPKRAEPTPETPAQALARAGVHARAAGAEAAAALQALLDAASLAAAGAPGSEAAAPLAATLEAVEKLLRPHGPGGPDLLTNLHEALEAEIERWQRRGDDDAEARAVLRAFLGLREILWEMGVRAPRQERPEGAAAASREEGAERRKPRKARLQRVEVQG